MGIVLDRGLLSAKYEFFAATIGLRIGNNPGEARLCNRLRSVAHCIEWMLFDRQAARSWQRP
jgi:hypothetical protein